jgi:hypothetical protein
VFGLREAILFFDTYEFEADASALISNSVSLYHELARLYLLNEKRIRSSRDERISIQVIRHGSLERIRATIKEMTRVLRDEGLVWVTVPVSKNEPSTAQEQIEPGTFVPLDGREKGLPHHYTMDELLAEFHGFRTIDLHVDPTNHFSLFAQKVTSLPQT